MIKPQGNLALGLFFCPAIRPRLAGIGFLRKTKNTAPRMTSAGGRKYPYHQNIYRDCVIAMDKSIQNLVINLIGFLTTRSVMFSVLRDWEKNNLPINMKRYGRDCAGFIVSLRRFFITHRKNFRRRSRKRFIGKSRLVSFWVVYFGFDLSIAITQSL
jgi:hypothetical protein